MGLFEKKFCDICGGKIGLLGNRKLEDGNMCKDCAALLSPFMTDRRRTTLAEIKDHLAYREKNKAEVEKFNVTRTFGGNTKLLLDEDAGKILVTSSGRWKNENPDVIPFSQITGCETDIVESKTEQKTKDKDGNSISYVPPRYTYEYDFNVIIHINCPWFSEIKFTINRSRIEGRGSVDYQECERQASEIKEALTQLRQGVRENAAAAAAPREAKRCPSCGATTTPDASNRCEFCGGALG